MSFLLNILKSFKKLKIKIKKKITKTKEIKIL